MTRDYRCPFCDSEHFDSVEAHTEHMWREHDGRGLPPSTQRGLARRDRESICTRVWTRVREWGRRLR